MRNKKGFTLVELLAVIVLLAIIALIIVQSVTGILKDARKDADDVNISRYLRYIDNALGIKDVEDGTYPVMSNGDICLGTISNSECTGKILELKLSGEFPTDGEVTIEDGNIIDYSLLLGDDWFYKNGEGNGENSGGQSSTVVDASCFISTTPGQINDYKSTCPKSVIMPEILQLQVSIPTTAVFNMDKCMTAAAIEVQMFEEDIPVSEIESLCENIQSSFAEQVADMTSEDLLNDIALRLYGDLVYETSGEAYNIDSIGMYAFAIRGLTSMEISSQIKKIDMYAFTMNDLTNLVIPNSVVEIQPLAFSFNKLPLEQAFIYGRNADGTKDDTTVIGYGGASKSVTIPSNVTTIGEGAFAMSLLENVVIPNSVTTIGDGAFEANKLSTVIIPDSVTTMGAYAFDFNKITNLTIGKGLTSIPEAAFYDNKLESVTIPDTITIIESGAFKQNKITTLTIPSSVEKINSEAFERNKISSLTLSKGLTSIGIDAFYANNLTTVIIPDTVTTIGSSAFNANNLTTVTIGSGITTIDSQAFGSTTASYSSEEYGPNALTSVTINTSKSQVTLGTSVFGWASGYTDENIVWGTTPPIESETETTTE